MKKSLKKITAASVTALILVLCLAGCGNSSNSKKTISDYEKIVRSEAVSFKSYKKVNPLTDLTALSLESEVDEDDETERHTAESDAKVYSKNTTMSQVIGKLEIDDEVLVIEKLAGTNWYKIVFNGRVAYVQTSVLEAKSDYENSYNNYFGFTTEETEEETSTEHAEDGEDDSSETDVTEETGDSGNQEDTSESEEPITEADTPEAGEGEN